jgi:hypothetical protein
MKIPSHLIPLLLAESVSFRQYVTNLLLDSADAKKRVLDLISQADGKIDAIKKIRQFFEENRVEFRAAFPDVEISYAHDNKQIIGLATAKRFVESLRNFD